MPFNLCCYFVSLIEFIASTLVGVVTKVKWSLFFVWHLCGLPDFFVETTEISLLIFLFAARETNVPWNATEQLASTMLQNHSFVHKGVSRIAMRLLDRFRFPISQVVPKKAMSACLHGICVDCADLRSCVRILRIILSDWRP